MKEDKPTFQHPQPQSNEPAQDQIAGVDSEQSQQISTLASNVAQIQNRRINFNTDILGLFQTVSVAPTQIPNSPYQQVQIYVNGGTLRLYWYDGVGNTWHYVTATA